MCLCVMHGEGRGLKGGPIGESAGCHSSSELKRITMNVGTVHTMTPSATENRRQRQQGKDEGERHQEQFTSCSPQFLSVPHF